ncbi:transposase [Tsukamurella ocularis]|uniref:IS110 family transposase n=1 Tax=Tsukamurella ocularis TaxID=1970234 RepID=UPI0021698118|nr:IS110 family transposase [Tsukamurella ocularis]MCS3787597.1 transposase [Tsukamurella ocularis]
MEGLDSEIADLDHELKEHVAAATPTPVAKFGIGTAQAAQFLISAGENIGRLPSGAGVARLCGAAPIPIVSGKTHRVRLRRGGDGQVNRALHMIAVVRSRCDPKPLPTWNAAAQKASPKKTSSPA